MWPARIVIVASALVAVSSSPSSIRAQRAPVVSLRPASSVSEDGFTRVLSVRELADGRTLVSDGGADMRLAVVDWTSGAVRTIGREGAGPGEYRSVNVLFPIGGDSTFMEDFRNGRWLILHGARAVSTVQPKLPRHRAPVPTPLAGADRRGRVLEQRGYALRGAPGQPPIYPESLLVVLTQRDGTRSDTLARIGRTNGARGVVMKPVQRGGRPIAWHISNPLSASDQALLFEDGWVAVVQAGPYRVDWRAPDGRRVRATLPFAPVRVDDRQKRAVLAREYDADWSPDEFPPWPAVLPPFLRGSLLAAPGGQLVVERTLDANRPGRFYDVVDRAARLARQIALKESERLVGFGARSAYVVETDDDDLQWLRRHPWP